MDETTSDDGERLMTYGEVHEENALFAEEVARLREEVKECRATIDLGWKRSVEANKLWRNAHPGNDLVMADLGDLLTWLMEKLARLRAALDEYGTHHGCAKEQWACSMTSTDDCTCGLDAAKQEK